MATPERRSPTGRHGHRTDGKASRRWLTTTAAARAVDARAWVEPLDDGGCPAGHPVKANDRSGIYHVPGGRFYDRTVAVRCYASPEAAAADGYRPAKA